MDVGRIDTNPMAKVVEKVVIKKDAKKELKLLNSVGHVEIKKVNATKNDTYEDSLVPSIQSLDVEPKKNEDQNGVDIVVNMSLQQDYQCYGLVTKHLAR